MASRKNKGKHNKASRAAKQAAVAAGWLEDAEGRMQQATDFNVLLEYLRDNNLAACLQPEQGRLGCLVPMSGYDYAARVISIIKKVRKLEESK